MREIKFRAWHKESAEMVYFDNKKMKIDQYQAGHLIELMCGECGDVLMQYSGLKDKNGAEIYEGDIVVLMSADGYEQEEPYVVNDICEFWGNFNRDDFYYLMDLSRSFVIGNIYENPKLLGDEL